MKLNEPSFRPFPIRAITPKGWLAEQLRIQVDGLSGHLDEFWPDIKDSAWIGGKADGWERMPYWLDGAIPLAWLTDDVALKQRIAGYVDYIVCNQKEDGWLGPRVEERSQAADLWSQALALKVLTVYYDATVDPRIPAVIQKALRMLDRYIDGHPLSNWGQFRWFEFMVSIWWMYERTRESWLLDLAIKLHSQGFGWKDFFQFWPLKEATEKGRWNYAGHVVNNAMAVKEGGLWWRLTGDAADKAAATAMIDALDKYHGMPTGIFTGDECLAGNSATQGTELCAVAEYMYSLECLVSAFGDSSFSDRLELIAFNALPATFSPDMWSHQYDQQLNQIECSVRDRNWNSNGPDSNIFGLEPHYGCCTSNLSQAWPKFATSLWMRAKGGGIAATAYAPSRLETEVQGIHVSIELNTDYPFRTDLRFTVSVGKPVKFPLHLRIPAWAEGAKIEINGKSGDVKELGAYHTIKRSWDGETHVVLKLPMAFRTLPRPNNAVSISRGPLVFALKIGEEWRRINAETPCRELPHADWEVHPTTPWNYALEIQEHTAATAIRVKEHPAVSPVFSPEHPPLSATITARRVAAWVAENGSAGPTPVSPVQADGAPEDVVLIPYGCTNLRIAEFPVVDQARKAAKSRAKP